MSFKDFGINPYQEEMDLAKRHEAIDAFKTAIRSSQSIEDLQTAINGFLKSEAGDFYFVNKATALKNDGFIPQKHRLETNDVENTLLLFKQRAQGLGVEPEKIDSKLQNVINKKAESILTIDYSEDIKEEKEAQTIAYVSSLANKVRSSRAMLSVEECESILKEIQSIRKSDVSDAIFTHCFKVEDSIERHIETLKRTESKKSYEQEMSENLDTLESNTPSNESKESYFSKMKSAVLGKKEKKTVSKGFTHSM